MYKIFYEKNDTSPSEICFDLDTMERCLAKARWYHPDAWAEKIDR